MTDLRPEPPNATARTIAVALATNIGIAIAKVIAAAITGSTAMTAEASHALADAGNQFLLLVASRRSVRVRDARHPFGYGREAYFWALLASVVVFVAGAVFSLREGVLELIHPAEASSFAVIYTVLTVSIMLDSVSLIRAVQQLRAEARVFRRDFLDHVVLTSDPTVRAVFAEDAVAIAGDVIAIAAVALHHATGSTAPEGWAAVMIGVMLIGVGLHLARRNHDFLLGEQASVSVKDDVRTFIAACAGVTAIVELSVSFVGPRQLWVLARIDIADDLRGDEVEVLVRSIESGLQQRSVYIGRVDVVPVGRPPNQTIPFADPG